MPRLTFTASLSFLAALWIVPALATAADPAAPLEIGPAIRGAIAPVEVPGDEDTAQPSDTPAVDETPQPLIGSEAGEPTHEIVRERYPNRRVKIEREMILDNQGNYVFDGTWKMWDPAGTLVAEGRYEMDRRVGLWRRWYRGNESRALGQAPYNQFAAPYLSQATFDDGQLHGKWTIHDSKSRKIHEIDFDAGDRHGTATWWYPNGRKMREITYDRGQIDGHLREWRADGTLATDDTYEQGRKLAAKTTYYRSSRKKTEGRYLFARIVVKTPDDWWNAKFAQYAQEGRDERHGPWVAWYETGQKREEGEYQNDIPVGKFTWWYANGQRMLEGQYDQGRRHGEWSWWHENGQRATRGEYAHDAPVGRWAWWKDDGHLARAANFNPPANVAEKPAGDDGPDLKMVK